GNTTSCAALGDENQLFFAVAKGAQAGDCRTGGTDDLAGCGAAIGDPADPSRCAPLDRVTTNYCSALPPPWDCGSDNTSEVVNVVKPGSELGGVLCCRFL